MRPALALALLASSSQPQPLPDASPTLRGAVNTGMADGGIQWFRGPKGNLDLLTVAADAGGAYASACVTFGALGACPARGNVLQCVFDAGWYACQTDDAGNRAWAQIGAGSGGSANISASAPLQATAGNVAVDTSSTLAIRQVNTSHVDAGTGTFAGIVTLPEIDAPTLNAPIEIIGNCNPSTTTCAALNVDNTAPSVQNYIQTWSSGGVKKAIVYNDGTFGNYPSTVSTHIVYADQIQDPTGASGVIAFSDRSASSVGPDFSVDTAALRTAGALQQWKNSGSVKASVDPAGMFVGGIGGAGSLASFEDGTGVSGHPSLTCAIGLYPVILGRLGEDHDAIETDGGRPRDDGGTDVCTETDGGTYYCYGGKHGGGTYIDSQQRFAGWMWQWMNPTGGQGVGSAISYTGALVDYGGLQLSQFGGPSRLINTSAGQFYEGEFESAFRYAEGPSGNEHHYFVQGPANPDGGTTYDFSGPGGQWRQIPYSDETLTLKESPSGKLSGFGIQSDDSTFIAGTKTVTFSASQQYASTPSCWCNDTAVAVAGSPSGCQFDVANSNNSIVAFVGVGTHAFHWWCIGR